MNYKLIVTDYDMTLTTTKREITPRTVKDIHDFQANGGIFAICTSRPLNAVDGLLKGVDARTIITNQGANIYDTKTNECIFKKVLTKEEVQIITSYFKDKSNHIFLLNDKKSVCKVYGLEEFLCNKIVKYSLTKIGDKIFDYYPEDEGVSQIIVFGKTPKKINMLCEKAKNDFKDRFEIGLCDKYMLNITAKGVTKGSAITEIIKHFGLTKEDSIAFGDSQNDESMFTAVKTGVAMGNSMEELKQVADVVCDTCDNEGLAKYIEEHIL